MPQKYCGTFEPPEQGARTLQTTDDRQTHGQATANSEREPEFAFAKNGRSNIVFTDATVLKTTEAAASVASNVATALRHERRQLQSEVEAIVPSSFDQILAE